VIAWRRRLAGVSPRVPAAVALAAVLLAAVLLAGRGGPAPPAPGELRVSFLDVGQGDATLLQRDGATVLVDTGPPDGPVVRRLAQEGVDRLDVLLLTHAQADHEGAALDVIRTYRPRLVLNGGDGRPSRVQAGLAAAVEATGSRTVAAHAGRRLTLGGMTFDLLWPPPRSPGSAPAGDPNERAVVAHVTVGAFDLLLPADAESAVSGRLALPEVEVLKVAHHGSADEALPALLERLRPKVAAIPVGRGNSYGHPAPSTLAALRAVPHVMRTDQDGTIRLRVRRGQLTVERSGIRR
jgi:competence protein ComEC